MTTTASGGKPLKQTLEYVEVYAPVFRIKTRSPDFRVIGIIIGRFSYKTSTLSHDGPAKMHGPIASASFAVSNLYRIASPSVSAKPENRPISR